MAEGWPGTMRFDVYGRYQLEVVRDGGRWVVYRLARGKRHVSHDFAVPASLGPDELATYLDDMLHEWARPGDRVRRVD